MRSSRRSDISLLASAAKAKSKMSLGCCSPFWISQAALDTITDVFPLPADATTKLASSSVMTLNLCSSVSGLVSISSNSRLCLFNSKGMYSRLFCSLVLFGESRKLIIFVI